MIENPRRQPWVRTVQDLVAVLPGVVSDRLELLALELHRAGRGMVQIVALVLATAVLCATAWLALCTGLALILVELGLSLPWALLVVLVANLLLAWAALSRVRHLLVSLGLPATRRHLVFGAAARSAAGAPLPPQPFTGNSEGST